MLFPLKEKFPFRAEIAMLQAREKNVFLRNFLGSDPFISHNKPGQQRKQQKQNLRVIIYTLNGFTCCSVGTGKENLTKQRKLMGSKARAQINIQLRQQNFDSKSLCSETTKPVFWS